MLKDISFSAIVAGFIAVAIGFASAVSIVFQAATAAGANETQIESWIWALGIGMGITSFGLSWYYKNPIIIVWSTPGAALLATSLQGEGLAQTTGTFMVVGLMIILTGLSGLFSRLSQLIPLSIASAMLAGILFQFGLGIFTTISTTPVLLSLMFVAFLLGKLFFPRYSILFVLLTGVLYSIGTGALNADDIEFSIALPSFVMPTFSLSSIISIGIPLFIVTMASQNLPGAAILRSSGYEKQAISPIITTTGAATFVLAPLGGFTFNLAAITAAICTSEESHPRHDKRYIAGLSAGVFNTIAGIFGAAVVSLFAAFGSNMIAILAGLALISTIGASLHKALENSKERDAALIAFLITASNVSFLGVSSAFWGIVIGMFLLKLLSHNE